MNTNSWYLYAFLVFLLICGIVVAYYLFVDLSYPVGPTNAFVTGDRIRIRSLVMPESVGTTSPLYLSQERFPIRQCNNPTTELYCNGTILTFSPDPNAIWTLSDVSPNFKDVGVLDYRQSVNAGFGDRLMIVYQPTDALTLIPGDDFFSSHGDLFVYNVPSTLTFVDTSSTHRYVFSPFLEPVSGLGAQISSPGNNLYRMRFNSFGDPLKPNDLIGRVRPSPAADNTSDSVSANNPGIAIQKVAESDRQGDELDYLFYVEKV